MATDAGFTSDVSRASARAGRRGRAVAGLALFALTLAACGSDDDTSDAVESVLSSPQVSGPLSSASVPSRDEAEDRASEAQQALEDGDFSRMANALRLSGLADEIEERSTTILAPTDDAFNALGASKVAELLADRNRLRETLRRHVLNDAYSYDELRAMTKVTTLDGDTLTVAVEGARLVIGGATVTKPDVDKASGKPGQELMVLAIDRVLTDAR